MIAVVILAAERAVFVGGSFNGAGYAVDVGLLGLLRAKILRCRDKEATD